MQNMMLATRAMGYDSCLMIGFDIDKVAEMIKLPDHYVMGAMLVMGKKTKDVWPKPDPLPLSELVTENSFNGEPCMVNPVF